MRMCRVLLVQAPWNDRAAMGNPPAVAPNRADCPRQGSPGRQVRLSTGLSRRRDSTSTSFPGTRLRFAIW